MFEIPKHNEAVAYEVADGITQMTVGNDGWEGTGTPNFYIVEGRKRAAIIDTGMGTEQEIQLFADTWQRIGAPPIGLVVVTHSHFDHDGGVEAIEKIAESKSHGGNGTALKRRKFDLGGRSLEIIPTPGHTQDSLVVRDTKTGVVFTGDTVIGADSVLVSAGIRNYVNSLERIKEMQPTLLLSGHGQPIFNVSEKIDTYTERVIRREQGMVRLIARGVSSVHSLVKGYYGYFGSAAEITAQAHIDKLIGEGIVGYDPNGKLILMKNIG